uniref:hypothetical protein n=1 Tax=Methylobacterium sp. B34 TaxID=95563 RepID=UPI0016512F7E|nr:hypothetical protein [Methylobacterium sp. B34]
MPDGPANPFDLTLPLRIVAPPFRKYETVCQAKITMLRQALKALPVLALAGMP